MRFFCPPKGTGKNHAIQEEIVPKVSGSLHHTDEYRSKKEKWSSLMRSLHGRSRHIKLALIYAEGKMHKNNEKQPFLSSILHSRPKDVHLKLYMVLASPFCRWGIFNLSLKGTSMLNGTAKLNLMPVCPITCTVSLRDPRCEVHRDGTFAPNSERKWPKNRSFLKLSL